ARVPLNFWKACREQAQERSSKEICAKNTGRARTRFGQNLLRQKQKMRCGSLRRVLARRPQNLLRKTSNQPSFATEVQEKNGFESHPRRDCLSRRIPRLAPGQRSKGLGRMAREAAGRIFSVLEGLAAKAA